MDLQEIGQFELDEPTAKKWAINGLVLLVLSLIGFSMLPWFAGKGLSGGFHWYTIPVNALATVLLLLLHELIHGLTISLWGAKARYTYGVKAGIPYLATTTDSTLTLPQYLAVALAPVVIITLAGSWAVVNYPQTVWQLALPLAFHTSGAIGDLSMAKVLHLYPRSSIIKDELTGFRVYAPKEDPGD